MKKCLSIIFTVFLFCSCNGGSDSLTIKGKFGHLRDGMFCVYSTHPQWSGFDTVRIVEGKFAYSCIVTDTMVMTLQFPNYMQMAVVGVPGGTIKIKGDANNLLAAQISGTFDNDLLTSFRKSIIGTTGGQELKMAEDFIRNHPSSHASEALFRKYFLDVQTPDFEKASSLFRLITKASPKRLSLKRLQSQYGALFKCRKGNTVSPFEAVTIKGDTVNNKTFKGKPCIVWFWSSWTDAMHYPVTSARSKFRPWLKDVRMLNICLDADTTGMRKRMERDSVPGYVVCDRQGWLSPMVTQMGVRFLPTAMLLDEKGVVIERDMDLESLTNTLKKKFDKQ